MNDDLTWTTLARHSTSIILVGTGTGTGTDTDTDSIAV